MITLPDDSPVYTILPGTLPSTAIVQFLTYSVAQPGQQWYAPRELHRLPLSGVAGFLNRTTLAPDQELSITSAVWYHHGHPDHPHAHLVMADLCESPGQWTPPTGSSFAVNDEYGNPAFEAPAYYDTGRGRHVYWPSVYTGDRGHVRFLGELLCVREPFLDVRAAGYALRRGYVALRLTQNTDRYLQPPRRV